MGDYRAPLKDILFALEAQPGFEQVQRLEAFAEIGVNTELAETVLEEAARLAAEAFAPLYRLADVEGTPLVDGQVRIPEEIKGAYQQFVAGGWGSLACDPAYEGQGLPHVIATPVMEMWKSANLALSLCPMLTNGAIEAIHAHGSEELKATYLPKMVAGEWTGTMNLTEPQAGSDLAAVKTKAVPAGDHYRISGRKIFITWGDHDMTDNIIHLVLARLPDAPPGVRGISLFLVPKFLVEADGSVGARNDVVTVSVEHKLGIHGSPTCVLSFGDDGGAEGYLVGEENNGLACMFTMMNHARLAVGVEGLAVSELGLQKASEYAKERVQGQLPGQGAVSIIQHPDVRRMLMTMRAYVEAMRGLAYVTATGLDIAHHGSGAEERNQAAALVGVLTPVVKGWSTEIGQEMASLAIQVHGGMGFVEETGVAQIMRDARITTIYEGTTGIQANDLIGRKLIRDNGRAMTALIQILAGLGEELKEYPELRPLAEGLGLGRTALNEAKDFVLANHEADPLLAGSASFNFLMLAGTVLGGWQIALGARRAAQRLASGDPDKGYLEAKITTANFYAQHLMPKADAYLAAIQAGSQSLMGVPEEQL